MICRAVGFAPVWDGESVALILGSFPSVKSRETDFYYGNPQNKFWRTVCGFFGEDVPQGNEGKKEFLLRRRIALWDVVIECEIEGSSDSSIRSARIADLPAFLEGTKIGRIYCNGSKSYTLLLKYYPQYAEITVRLPSTSPANVSFSCGPWQRALAEIKTLGESQ